MQDYIHGYSSNEARRLTDQATTLAELLHHDTSFPPGSNVLEAGCGTGAQTLILSRNSPLANITSIDLSPDSLAEARAKANQAGLTNVTFQVADLYRLPFEGPRFDHVFICFVLEHLSKPVEALRSLKACLKPGGSLTVIEGDHGSVLMFPRSESALEAIQCQVDLQAAAGGNALIGRELYPLLRAAGFEHVRVSPRMVYVDASKPEWVEGFVKKTFTAMIEGVREKALETGRIDVGTYERAVQGLLRTTESNGVFCYTFFKAVAEAS